MCGLVDVYYTCLCSFGYSFDDIKVVMLCVKHFFRVLSEFYSRFGSLLVTLGVCRWGGRCVLLIVYCD